MTASISGSGMGGRLSFSLRHFAFSPCSPPNSLSHFCASMAFLRFPESAALYPEQCLRPRPVSASTDPDIVSAWRHRVLGYSREQPLSHPPTGPPSQPFNRNRATLSISRSSTESISPTLARLNSLVPTLYPASILSMWRRTSALRERYCDSRCWPPAGEV